MKNKEINTINVKEAKQDSNLENQSRPGEQDNPNSDTFSNAPRGMRLRIAILGKRNAGKSSLLNALANQEVSLVSDIAGTTTDPVERPMEFLPLGPVIFIDTAGLDDEGELGQKRVDRTTKLINSLDLAVICAQSGTWGDFEEGLAKHLSKNDIPYVIAFTKSDLKRSELDFDATVNCAGNKTSDKKDTGAVDTIIDTQNDMQNQKESTPTSPGVKGAKATVYVSSITHTGIEELHDAIVSAFPANALIDPPILTDIIPKNGVAVLVIPIDKQAPKGRLILPQVQTIRDLLDEHCMAFVTTDEKLDEALKKLASPPDIVVTDSQAFARVAQIVPDSVPMTSFSILFARFKGDLRTLVEGAARLSTLDNKSKVLIAESCTHHKICDDIGSVKIPKLLHTKISPDIKICNCSGKDFPNNLSEFDLVIHCGGCMINRTAMHARIQNSLASDVPMTNYGMAIAHTLGILPRALKPFAGMAEIYNQART